jgi:hypothetical protein
MLTPINAFSSTTRYVKKEGGKTGTWDKFAADKIQRYRKVCEGAYSKEVDQFLKELHFERKSGTKAQSLVDTYLQALGTI